MLSVTRSLTGLALATALLAGCGGGEEEKKGNTERPAAAEKPAPAKLAAQWWVWAEREGDDPIGDKTGKRCAAGQPSDVFFLAGTAGGRARRTCTVPADTPLFFPILNRRCPVEGGSAEQAAQACGKGLRGAAKTTVEVDGRAVEPRYVVSPRFDLGAGAGAQVAVGYHVSLDPLESGEHTIRFRGSDADGFELDVRYRLTVR